MGRKVHPLGFRIGIIRDWQAKWYADKHYPEFIQEDVKIRKAIRLKYNEAGVSLVEIERQANRVMVTIYTSRPGIVIGRGGQRVDETRHYLEELIDKRVQLNIQEIRQPELDAYLVARTVAEQIERRIAYRRAMKQALFRTIQAGAKGMRIICSGRLGGVEIARRQMMHQGRVPLHTLRADIDYGFTEAHTTLGRIGIKVWIYRGDILPEVEEMVGETIIRPMVEGIAEKEIVTEEMEKQKREKPDEELELSPEVADVGVTKPRTKKVAKKPQTIKEEKPKEEKTDKKIAGALPVEITKEVKSKAKKTVKKKVTTKEIKKPNKEISKKKETSKAIKIATEPKTKKATKVKQADKSETSKRITKSQKEKAMVVDNKEEIQEVKADATTKKSKIQKKS
jgi:small subunit ribosomal protein S3